MKIYMISFFTVLFSIQVFSKDVKDEKKKTDVESTDATDDGEYISVEARKTLEESRKERKALEDLLKNRIKPKKVLINGWVSDSFFRFTVSMKSCKEKEDAGTEIPNGSKSINGFCSRSSASLLFRKYLKQGNNELILRIPKSISTSNPDKYLSAQIHEGLKVVKEYLIPIRNNQESYKVSLKIEKMPVELSWNKAKSWKSLPKAEETQISEIVKAYYTALKSNSKDKFFDFKNKYESLGIRDTSVLNGYPPTNVKWDKYRNLYEPEFLDHPESGLSNKIEIRLSPENDKVVVVSTADGGPIFKLFVIDSEDKVVSAREEKYFLNFINVDGRWEIY
jgi:hypothetical protein